MNKPIEVEGGKVAGELLKDSGVLVYKGIPYAAAPVGALRWKAPQSVIAWDGVRKCTKFGASAVQPEQKPFMMWSKEFIIDTETGYSEDCLSLNVWTKDDKIKKNRPVIVFIHGGGFVSGGSSCEVYDGEEIAKKGVVYVSINYRVGIFGYLAHPELSAESPDKVSGNYAVLDQIAALKWVKNNISKFGGDPNNVTIVGQSAGSASVELLIMSPKAKGLFKNAVTMSFNCINWKFDTMEEKEAEASKLFSNKTLKDMRAMTSDELLNIQANFGPVVDGKIIPDNLLDILKAGTQNDVNLMTGMVNGDIFLFQTLPSKFLEASAMTKEDFEADVKNTFGAYANKCLEAYPVKGDEAIEQLRNINKDGQMALQSYFAKAKAVNSKKPTYIYNFSHVMPGENSKEFGAFHTADVPYFFNYFSPLRKSYWTQEDYDLGDRMSSYLVNFAKTGDPNGEGLEKWKEYTGEILFIDLGDTICTKKVSKEKVEFWEKYFKKFL